MNDASPFQYRNLLGLCGMAGFITVKIPDTYFVMGYSLPLSLILFNRNQCAINDVVAVSFYENLYTIMRGQCHQFGKFGLPLRVQVGFRIFNQKDGILFSSEDRHDNRQRI